ncbi:MAG: TIGR04282 family arsenosugar biosynthesis glycosyltransferase [Pseudonocardia sp.]
MDQPRARILVMAKAPVAGHAKTRLEPLLGPDGCARLQAALVAHTVRVAAALAPTSVAVAGDLALVAPLVPPGVELFAQCAGDLGTRLTTAAAAPPVPPASPRSRHGESAFPARRVRVLDTASPQIQHGAGVGAAAVVPAAVVPAVVGPAVVGPAVVVIGTDCPQLGAEHVDAALARLAVGDDVVFGPAHDGGYYLVALAASTPPAPVFALPPAAWGGPDVLALSLAAATRAGLRAGTITAEHDLDTPADAAHARTDPRIPPPIAALLTPSPTPNRT